MARGAANNLDIYNRVLCIEECNVLVLLLSMFGLITVLCTFTSCDCIMCLRSELPCYGDVLTSRPHLCAEAM